MLPDEQVIDTTETRVQDALNHLQAISTIKPIAPAPEPITTSFKHRPTVLRHTDFAGRMETPGGSAFKIYALAFARGFQILVTDMAKYDYAGDGILTRNTDSLGGIVEINGHPWLVTGDVRNDSLDLQWQRAPYASVPSP